MTYGTYQRLNVNVDASNVTVIRAARRKLAKRCWHDPSYREGRKLFFRNMLDFHHANRAMVRAFNL